MTPVELEELSFAIEALLFAQAEPMDFAAIRQALRRALPEDELPEGGDDGQAGGAEAAADGVAQQGADGAAAAGDADAQAADGATAAKGGDEGGELADHGTEEGAQLTNAGTDEVGGISDAPRAVEAGAAEAAEPAELDGPADQGGVTPAADPSDPTFSEGMAAFALTSPVIHRPKPATLSVRLRQALDLLQARWRDPHNRRGFQLVEVGGGYTFRTNVRFAEFLRAVREAKPQRLSRPAMESLAIVAYRQPVTKPEIDHLRGVDSGGSLKVLLERKLVAVVGKKEEPGRPLLYGTTPEFLHFFNLRDLTFLPSLREFHELTDDAAEAVRALEGLPDIASLAQEAKNFRADEILATDEVEEALLALQRTQGATRAALLAQGVTLDDDGDDEGAARPPASAEPAPTHH